MLRTLVKIHGGKHYLSKFLLAHFPPDIADLDFYDVCGGGGTVTLRKPPSREETYNDLDPELANLFSVASTRGEDFVAAVSKLDYTEETFASQKGSRPQDPLGRAVRELVIRRMSRGGLKKDFSYSKRLRGGRPGDVNAWVTWKEGHLPKIADRLRGIQVLNMDAVRLVREYDHPGAMFFIDPPYYPSTRSVRKVYDCEMTERQHRDLGEVLRGISGKAMVCGYDCPLYNRMFQGWWREQRLIANHSSQSASKQLRLECIWWNYPLACKKGGMVSTHTPA